MNATEQIAFLKRMLKNNPMTDVKRDIILRRIYALDNEIVYSNPFNDVDEMLYRCSKPAPPVIGSPDDPNRHYDIDQTPEETR